MRTNKYSAKLSGLSRVNWDNKSPKQQAQYFMKVYQELGLSVPQYLLDGKMSAKQLTTNINKLTKSLQSRAKKETQRIKKENERAKTETKKKLPELVDIYMQKTGLTDEKMAKENLKELEKLTKELANFKKEIDVNNLRPEFGDLKTLLDKGFDDLETLVKNESPSMLRIALSNLSEMVGEYIGERHLLNACARLGLSEGAINNILKEYRKLSNVKKLSFNTQLWDRFRIKYPKYVEEFNDTDDENEKEQILSEILSKAMKMKNVFLN